MAHEGRQDSEMNPCPGGHFSPEKKYLASPEFPADTLPPHPPPVLRDPPPPVLGFSTKTEPPPPPSRRPGLPLPVPRAKKRKNTPNVHQVAASKDSLSFLESSLVYPLFGYYPSQRISPQGQSFLPIEFKESPKGSLLRDVPATCCLLAAASLLPLSNH